MQILRVIIIMSDLRKGLISERKLKLIIITQLDEHHSLSSIFTNYIYYDILGSVTIHLKYTDVDLKISLYVRIHMKIIP